MASDVDDYLDFVPTPTGWALLVAVVTWPHPHEPTLNWKTFRQWRREPPAETKARARAAVVKRYFRLCSICGELCNVGHMHERDTCHGCAERVFGVIH
jgi:hypothetical protein